MRACYSADCAKISNAERRVPRRTRTNREVVRVYVSDRYLLFVRRKLETTGRRCCPYNGTSSHRSSRTFRMLNRDKLVKSFSSFRPFIIVIIALSLLRFSLLPFTSDARCNNLLRVVRPPPDNNSEIPISISRFDKSFIRFIIAKHRKLFESRRHGSAGPVPSAAFLFRYT